LSLPILEKFQEKIIDLGFTTAKFQYAFVKEEGRWKIFVMRILFDNSGIVNKSELLLKEEDFVLENCWESIDEFYSFVDALRLADVTNPTPKEFDFSLNDHQLSFRGNFPGKTVYYLNSRQARDHGLDRACYFIQYYLHDSAKSRAFDVSMTHHEPPFRNRVEAVNYHWHSNFDVNAMLSQPIYFYLPLLDASIKNCELNGTTIRIGVDVDETRTTSGELSLAVIAEGAEREHRKKHPVTGNRFDIDIGFRPLSFSVTLNRGSQILDEYSYYQNESSSFMNDMTEVRLSQRNARGHIVYTDGSFKEGKGFISWFNETTGQKYYGSASCKDSFRCEYHAIIHALENMQGYNEGDMIQIWCDSDPLVKQLKLLNGINEDDIRQDAVKIWDIVARQYHGRVEFVWIPRGNNKAGKIHGS
jgi:ribonuclease HI